MIFTIMVNVSAVANSGRRFIFFSLSFESLLHSYNQSSVLLALRERKIGSGLERSMEGQGRQIELNFE
jgi:hypothetical protein